MTENLRPGFATLLTAVGVRFAHRVQQRGESAPGSVQRTAPRDFAAAGVGRDARQRAATFCFRKRADQFAGGNSRRGPGVAVGAARAETGGELSPDRSRERDGALGAGARCSRSGFRLLTGFAMGLYPALQSSRADMVDALKEGGRGTAGSVRQQRFRKILVGAQVALSVTLLAGASLLITSFVRLSQQDPGFKTDNLWIGVTVMPQAQYPDQASRTRFAEQLQTTLRATPGFEDLMVSTGFPLFGGAGATLYTRPEGNVPPDRRAKRRAVERRHARLVPDAAGIPLIAGRDFNEQDVLDHPNVIIISKAGAKTVFGDENPIGKTLLITSGSVPVEIVGVVGDVRSVQLNQANDMEFYRPFAQENFPFLTIAVRSPLPPETITHSVQTALRGIDPQPGV